MSLLSSALTGLMIAERYRIERELGRGAMGVVYLATDTRLNRQVAIKRLRDDATNPEYLQRLKREALLLAQLNHANIVQLYDVVDEIDPDTGREHVSLIVEYVEGRNLAQVLREETYSSRQATDWLIQISKALIAAHSKNVVHRDLKTENILLTDGGEIKVTDFGIARSSGDPQTVESHVLGSYTALTPEQVSGGAITTKTDLFTLGILAYRFYSGHHPFGTVEAPALMVHNILYTEPAPLAELCPQLPGDLVVLIENLLAKDSAQRPASAEVLMQCLLLHRESFSDEGAEQETRDISALMQPAKINNSHLKHTQGFSLLKRWKIALGLLLIAAVCILAISKTLTDDISSKVELAVLDPVLVNKKGSGIDAIAISIKTAQEQMILNSKDLFLSPEQVEYQDAQTFQESLRGMGVPFVLSSTLDCDERRCDVELILVDTQTGEVIGKRTWPILVVSVYETYNDSMKQVAYVLSKISADQPSNVDIDQEGYEQYIDLLGIYLQIREFEQLLPKIRELAERLPQFYSVQHLYFTILEDAYIESFDKQYLTEYQTHLNYTRNLYPGYIRYFLSEFEYFKLYGDPENALLVLDQARELGLKSDWYFFYLSKLYGESGDFNRAVEYLAKSIGLNERMISLQQGVYLGVVSGQYDLAKKYIDRVFYYSPNNEYANYMIASINLINGNLGEAKSSFKKLVEVHSSELYVAELALVYLLSGEYGEARSLYARYGYLDSESLVVKLNIADTEKLLGNIESANLLYRKLLEGINKESEPTIENKVIMLQAYSHLGHKDEALEVMFSLIEDYSDNTHVLYSVAMFHALNGEAKSALFYMRKAVDNGMGSYWFALPWYSSLCELNDFEAMLGNEYYSRVCI